VGRKNARRGSGDGALGKDHRADRPAAGMTVDETAET
jgi:hypothetical protein